MLFNYYTTIKAYLCTKCSVPDWRERDLRGDWSHGQGPRFHKATSAIGKQHLEYQVGGKLEVKP